MEIVMCRGDLETRTFTIRAPDGNPFTEPLDEIYISVKKDAKDRNYLFQKRMSKGEIRLVDDGTYEFTINPNDTDGMAYGDHVFDIELVIDGVLKKTFVGKFVLLDEVTHIYNEV